MKSILKNYFTKMIKARGLTLAQSVRTSMDPSDVIIMDSVMPFTMTSEERIAVLLDAVNYIEANSIQGDIVECGVWKGGSSMAAAKALLNRNSRDRTLYLYDTYEGMSEPTEHDRTRHDSTSAAELMAQSTKAADNVWAYSPITEVKANLASTNYPSENVKFIQGKVEDTIPGTIPDKIALLRLDTDWYESTKHELTHLFPRLVSGGILIIDDFGYWEGAKRAVMEYIAQNNVKLFLSRIDYTGRVGVKI